MRRALAVTAVALLAAVAITSCGGGSSGGLIPQSTALTLNNDLGNIQAGVLAGQCSLTETQVTNARADFESLPPTINARLRTQLIEGFNALQLSAGRQCQGSQPSGSTGTTGSGGPTGPTGTTSSTTSSSTTSSTASSTTSSTATTTSSSAATTTTGTTTTTPGQTCTTAPSGGTVCSTTSTSTSTTSTNGLGGPASGGAGAQ
ncbi:MAG TPA: hypothetical protein VID68_09350 [Solirubrobacteraceae bacterium]